MRDSHKIKNQASDYYEGINREDYECDCEEGLGLDDEGDEIPYCLEHITSVKLYHEFMEETFDDYEVRLIAEGKKRERGSGASNDDN